MFTHIFVFIPVCMEQFIVLTGMYGVVSLLWFSEWENSHFVNCDSGNNSIPWVYTIVKTWRELILFWFKNYFQHLQNHYPLNIKLHVFKLKIEHSWEWIACWNKKVLCWICQLCASGSAACASQQPFAKRVFSRDLLILC